MPRTTEVADNMIAVAETASTNTLARQMLCDGTMAPPADGGAGVAVVATDVQSAGRGRLERTWVSAPGESMTCSYIATLPAGVIADGSVNGWLTVIAGFAALDALRGALAECGAASEDCGLRLKWPNDLFCQGRKLGGILTEMVPLPGRDDSVALVIGIGINLAIPADRLPTEQSTSLQLHVQGLPDARTLRDMIAAHIVRSLSSRLSGFVADPHAAAERLREETSRVCWTLGRRVEARFTDGSVLTGTATALNADASLSVRDDAGENHVVHTADVGVLPL